MRTSFVINHSGSAFLVLFTILFARLHGQIITTTYSYTGSMQTFTVPACVSALTIEARGAGGGSVTTTCPADGGLGAGMVGEFNLTSGQVLNILVGGVGMPNTTNEDAGGGGGSFVVDPGNTPLIVAGGGGGATNNITNCGSNRNGMNASVTTTATANSSGISAGGANGNGGSFIGTGGSGAGGGFYTNGANAQNIFAGGKAYVNGGAGGSNSPYGDNGGYGGGGAGWQPGGGGGGGGGYSGGGASSNLPYAGGGGGSSYNSGANQVNTASVQAGNGLVIISFYPYIPVTISASSPTTCSNAAVTLSANLTTYTWSNNTFASSLEINPASTTTYTLQGTISGCPAFGSITIGVTPSPTVTAAVSVPTLCSGLPLTITGGGAATYSIASVLPDVAAGESVAFYPTLTNTYIVTGTNASGDCSAATSVSVIVVTTPTVLPFANPPAICAGETATLSGSGASTYSWMPVNLSTSSIVVNPAGTTIYTLGQSNADCMTTAFITLTVYALPAVTATSSSAEVCAGEQATLTGTGANTYSWTAGSGVTLPNNASVTDIPLVNTTYTLTASDGTCSNTSTVSVISNPLPTITIVPSSTNICQGETLTLTATGADNGYTWTPVASGSASFTDMPLSSTQYSVIGENTLHCSSSAQMMVTVNALPLFSVAVNNTLVCASGPATITATGTGNLYNSSPGGPLTNDALAVNPAASTVYTVTATSTLTGCHDSTTVSVSVFIPSVTAGASSSTLCAGETVTLSASGADSYTWTGSPASASLQVTPASSTFYVVSAETSSAAIVCPSSATVQLTVFANPTLTAAPERSNICIGETTTLTAQGALTYLWDDSQTTAAISVSPGAPAGQYTVVGFSAEGCSDTAVVAVDVIDCVALGIPEINRQAGILVYPNPNNGEFFIQSEKDADLQLVNGLGQGLGQIRLSEANAHKTTVSGLPPGVYFITGGHLKYKLIVTR